MDADDPLTLLSVQVAAALERTGQQLVLAESCTAGLVAASLGGVPGISRHLCGSAVVYQEATKEAWLNVSRAVLGREGAVSADVAAAMTAGALAATRHADIAASVTGHLGPAAPARQDGLVFIAVQERGQAASVRESRLSVADGQSVEARRVFRQREATRLVLEQILAALE